MKCEWNPRFDTERGEVSPDGDCTAPASVVVGPKTARYALCAPCADRPYFSMFRERVPLSEYRIQERQTHR